MIREDQGKECTRKECKRHGQILPFEAFSKNRANPDGYEYHCKQCKGESAAALRERRRKQDNSGNGRRKYKPRNPKPTPDTRRAPVADPRKPNAIDGYSQAEIISARADACLALDAQLAVDLKAMKKRIAQEVMQICERAIEEAFA